jgi:2-amino-4-hydroxy-6-hydroxymethyldihydropteridine diphosphokinase
MADSVNHVPVQAWLGMGGNVGDVLGGFKHVLQMLSVCEGTRVCAVSSAYRTAAMTLNPDEKQDDYWNAVCCVETLLTPEALLDKVLDMERAWGRLRESKWGARTLDVDIVWYGEGSWVSDRVVVPHPGWRERLFVLAPLAELVSEKTLGGERINISALLRAHPDYPEGVKEVKKWF